MSRADLGPFPGLNPRYDRSRQGAGSADDVLDFDLSDGTLNPLYYNRTLAETATGNGYWCGCDFMDIEPCEYVTTVVGPCKHVVTSSNGDAKIGACGDERCDLRVEAPTTAPDVTIIDEGSNNDREQVQTQYAYTFTSKAGYETPLSYPSHPVSRRIGGTVSVSGFAEPPDSQCIEKFNVYRLATGYRSGTEEQKEALTDWLHVGTYPTGTLTITDRRDDIDLGEANTSSKRRTAPPVLRGVQANGVGDTLIGYTRTAVHQTMPGYPQWWPLQFQTDLGYEIKLLASCPSFSVAFTDEAAFIIQPGDAANLTCADPTPVYALPTPVQAHTSRGLCVTPATIIYASDEGLIELTGNGQFRNITAPWFSVDDWRKLSPETVRVGYDRQRILFTSDAVSYMVSTGTDAPSLVRISDRPDRYLKGPTGELLLVEAGQVRQFNAGDLRREGIWTKIAYTSPTRYRYARVDVAGLATLRINDATTTIAGEATKKCLAKYRKSTKQMITIRSSDEVFKLNLASSPGELSSAQF